MTRYLADTHVLLWAAIEPARLSATAVAALEDRANEVLFSSASIWEVATKSSLGRADFDATDLAQALRAHDYVELPVTAAHAARVARLPPLHHDPFDRLLIAQALVEDLVLLTRDARVLQYGGPIEAA